MHDCKIVSSGCPLAFLLRLWDVLAACTVFSRQGPRHECQAVSAKTEQLCLQQLGLNVPAQCADLCLCVLR